jgi:acyl-CoA dehydrogenase
MMLARDDDTRALAALCDQIFGDHCQPDQLAAVQGQADLALWRDLEDAGLLYLGIDETMGGDLRHVAIVLWAAGQHAASIPLAEAGLLGGWLLAQAGRPVPRGLITAGADPLTVVRAGGRWRVQGRLHRVPFARDADWIVALADGPDGACVVLLPGAECEIEPGASLAGEPRDEVIVDCGSDAAGMTPAAPGAHGALRLRGALSRAVLIAGALETALAVTREHVAVRQQFSRPISAFQAVQQQIAVLAAEVAAGQTAAASAVDSADGGALERSFAEIPIAAAKVRTAQAASAVASIAHHLHGAIGMTHEHRLRFTTSRLWTWRAEWEGEAAWAGRLGDLMLVTPAADLWAAMVGA